MAIMSEQWSGILCDHHDCRHHHHDRHEHHFRAMVWEVVWLLAPLATVCRTDRRGQGRRQVFIIIVMVIIITIVMIIIFISDRRGSWGRTSFYCFHCHRHFIHHSPPVVIKKYLFFIQARGRKTLVTTIIVVITTIFIIIVIMVIIKYFIQARSRKALVTCSSRLLGHSSCRSHSSRSSYHIAGCHPHLHDGQVGIDDDDGLEDDDCLP